MKRAAAALALLGLSARAEIGFDEPVIDELPVPPAIMVPEPERGVIASTNRPPDEAADGAGGDITVRFHPLPPPVLGTNAVLTLRTRETLQGALIAMTNDVLHWRHVRALDPVEVRYDAVAQVDFGHAPDPAATAPGACSVELVNGDEYFGRLVSVSDTQVVVEHGRLGALRVRRGAVARLVQSVPGARRTYVGPLHRDEWKGARPHLPAAGFDAGRLVLHGENHEISREAGMPERARIEFEATWERNATLAVLYHVSRCELVRGGRPQEGPLFASKVTVRSWGLSLELMAAENPMGGGVSMYENAELPVFGRPGRAQFTLFVSRPERIAALYMDGKLLKQWLGRYEVGGTGGGLGFGGNVTVGHVDVREWDGGNVETAFGRPGQESVLLANHERLSGRVQSADPTEVICVAPGGSEVPIPTERVQEMVLAPLRQTPPGAGETWLLFTDGSRLRVVLERLDAGGLAGKHAELGPLSLPLDAVQQMVPAQP